MLRRLALLRCLPCLLPPQVLFRYCAEEVAQARHSALFQRFIKVGRAAGRAFHFEQLLSTGWAPRKRVASASSGPVLWVEQSVWIDQSAACKYMPAACIPCTSHPSLHNRPPVTPPSPPAAAGAHPRPPPN